MTNEQHDCALRALNLCSDGRCATERISVTVPCWCVLIDQADVDGRTARGSDLRWRRARAVARHQQLAKVRHWSDLAVPFDL